jgi:hypothetical protein
LFWDGHAAERICAVIAEHFGLTEAAADGRRSPENA